MFPFTISNAFRLGEEEFRIIVLVKRLYSIVTLTHSTYELQLKKQRRRKITIWPPGKKIFIEIFLFEETIEVEWKEVGIPLHVLLAVNEGVC